MQISFILAHYFIAFRTQYVSIVRFSDTKHVYRKMSNLADRKKRWWGGGGGLVTLFLPKSTLINTGAVVQCWIVYTSRIQKGGKVAVLVFVVVHHNEHWHGHLSALLFYVINKEPPLDSGACA